MVTADGEFIVKTKKQLKCDCTTFASLFVCEHAMAVVRLRGKACYEGFIAAYKKCSSASKSGDGGRKPNEIVHKRHGGRKDKISSLKATSTIAAGGYLAIRKSLRISVCNGCKHSFGADIRHVIQHKCKLPYPAKSVDGKRVMVTPPAAGNHYFHLSRKCITSSEYHADFDGKVEVCPSVFRSSLIKEVKDGIELY